MLPETTRLILREMTDADYDALRAIMQDSQVMYAYEGPFTDEEVRAWRTGSWSATPDSASACGPWY